jgi:hypothetical protein
MGKGVVYPFSSNYLLVTSIGIEKGAVDKMTSHFITAHFKYTPLIQDCFCENRAHGIGGFLLSLLEHMGIDIQCG